jgi:hypothetical protein
MDSLPGFSPANKQAQTALATGTDGGKKLVVLLTASGRRTADNYGL